MSSSARAADTRRMLLDAARDAFETRGYRATTVADIVERAGTARGTFYLYFRNKEAVFYELMRELGDVLAREARPGALPEDREALVETATRQYLEAFSRRRGMWRAELDAFGGHRDVEQIWLELREDFVARIGRDLERWRARDEIRADLDVPMTAEALAAMTEWMAWIEFVVRDRPAEGERFERMVQTLTGLWILGTAAPL
ncbi:MAG TPA: helix-turn-helix domain-containing protein [Solirubrobacteraceae bacterium]|nr:helix-turn-helix domain-containing protein [Solirubrobacteraceae bacterium]